MVFIPDITERLDAEGQFPDAETSVRERNEFMNEPAEVLFGPPPLSTSLVPVETTEQKHFQILRPRTLAEGARFVGRQILGFVMPAASVVTAGQSVAHYAAGLPPPWSDDIRWDERLGPKEMYCGPSGYVEETAGEGRVIEPPAAGFVPAPTNNGAVFATETQSATTAPTTQGQTDVAAVVPSPTITPSPAGGLQPDLPVQQDSATLGAVAGGIAGYAIADELGAAVGAFAGSRLL